MLNAELAVIPDSIQNEETQAGNEFQNYWPLLNYLHTASSLRELFILTQVQCAHGIIIMHSDLSRCDRV
jgi:hypothetical protein